jgi:hypothetical protein
MNRKNIITASKRTTSFQLFEKKAFNSGLSKFLSLMGNDWFKNTRNAVVGVFLQKLIATVLICLNIIACDKVPFNPKIDDYNENLLVVDGIIGNHPDSKTIKLSRTSAYLNGKPYEMVEGATVEVTCEDQVFPFEEKDKGIYIAPDDWEPRVGNRYTLKIEFDGEVYKAESIMHKPANMHSLKVKPDDDDLYKVEGWIKDNKEKDEHFLFKYAINRVLNDSVQNWKLYSDKLVNNIWLENEPIFDEIDAKKGDTLKVLNFAIGESYYRFLEAAQKNIAEPMPFMPPAGILIEGNISNGALGFFEVSSIIQDSATVEK